MVPMDGQKPTPIGITITAKEGHTFTIGDVRLVGGNRQIMIDQSPADVRDLVIPASQNEGGITYG